MSSITERNDVAVVGKIYPLDTIFIIGMKIDGYTPNSPLRPLLYWNNGNSFVSSEGGYSYYLQQVAPPGYQLAYFIFSYDNSIDMIKLYWSSDYTLDFSQWGLIGAASTSSGNFELTSVSTESNHLTFNVTSVNNVTDQDSFQILASTPLYMYQNLWPNGSHSPATSDATGILNIGSVYDGLPTGITTSGYVDDDNFTYFLPIQWLSYGIDGNLTQSPGITNTIYHQCVSKRATQQDTDKTYYQNFCIDDVYYPSRGYTGSDEAVLSGGKIYDYGTITDGEGCGSQFDIQYDSLFVNRLTTQYVSGMTDINMRCIYNPASDIFESMDSLPSPCYIGSLSECDNARDICLEYIPCTAETVTLCGDQGSVMCAAYITDPCTPDSISTCDNAVELCEPYCRDPCTKTSIDNCPNAATICADHCPSNCSQASLDNCPNAKELCVNHSTCSSSGWVLWIFIILLSILLLLAVGYIIYLISRSPMSKTIGDDGDSQQMSQGNDYPQTQQYQQTGSVEEYE